MNKQWAVYQESETFAARVATLYGAGEGVLTAQKERYGKLVERFEKRFGEDAGELCFFSAPGRTEIGGNHTDHNNGRVLAAAVNLDTIACVAKTDDGVIVVDSEGFPPITVKIDALEVREADFGTTLSLIRGTAGIMQQMGYKVGGFRATISSSVLRGSGLSSSAAFEVLICAILDGLYNGFVIDAKTRAVIAQKVENIFFGKPCGLMDQMASSVGGMVTIDFETEDAKVEAIACDFAARGYALCVVNTGGNHGDLTDDDAAIRAEMEAVAAQFGKKVLRDVDEDEFYAAIPQLRKAVGDRAIVRAIHFYNDCRRAAQLCDAVRADDFDTFLRLIIEGGHSSFEFNQNAYSIKAPQEQGVPLALAISQKVLNGRGAWRLQGGGFAGTIQAFVPYDLLDSYRTAIDACFGEGSCHVLNIRNYGAVPVTPDM